MATEPIFISEEDCQQVEEDARAITTKPIVTAELSPENYAKIYYTQKSSSIFESSLRAGSKNGMLFSRHRDSDDNMVDFFGLPCEGVTLSMKRGYGDKKTYFTLTIAAKTQELLAKYINLFTALKASLITSPLHQDTREILTETIEKVNIQQSKSGIFFISLPVFDTTRYNLETKSYTHKFTLCDKDGTPNPDLFSKFDVTSGADKHFIYKQIEGSFCFGWSKVSVDKVAFTAFPHFIKLME